MSQPPNQPPSNPNQPVLPPGSGVPNVSVRQKPASMARYKRALRKETKRRALEPEINFLNITAMMDMMTIILVFLLKTLSTSTANLPQGTDLELPKSILTKEPDSEPEGLSVVISKSNVIVGDTVVCPVPPDAADYGIEAKYKRGSRNEYYIAPLAAKLQDWRDTDKRIRVATGKDPSSSEAIIIADQDTPYRLLTEVLYTLGQTEFAKFHMMVMQGEKK